MSFLGTLFTIEVFGVQNLTLNNIYVPPYVRFNESKFLFLNLQLNSITEPLSSEQLIDPLIVYLHVFSPPCSSTRISTNKENNDGTIVAPMSNALSSYLPSLTAILLLDIWSTSVSNANFSLATSSSPCHIPIDTTTHTLIFPSFSNGHISSTLPINSSISIYPQTETSALPLLSSHYPFTSFSNINHYLTQNIESTFPSLILNPPFPR